MLDTSNVAAQVSALVSSSSSQAMLRLEGTTGTGTTNTRVRRFTTTKSVDSANLQVTDSATLGLTVTVLTAGRYSISYTDAGSVASHMAIMLNDPSPNRAVDASAVSNVLSMDTSGNGTWHANPSWTGYLQAGSVLTAKIDNPTASPRASFTMVKL